MANRVARLSKPAFFGLGVVLTFAAAYLWLAEVFVLGTAADGAPGVSSATETAVKLSGILLVAIAALLVVATFVARMRVVALGVGLAALVALPAYAVLT